MENQQNIASLNRSIEKLKSLISKNNKQKVDEQLEELVASLQDPNLQQNQVEENDDDSGNFDYKNCEAYKQIKEKFDQNNSKITNQFLATVADAISKETGVKISRAQKRRGELLYKWFNDNWCEIKPVFDELELINDESVFNNNQ